jgi:hypothetical protein
MPRRTIVGIWLLAATLLATRGVAEDGLSMNRVSLTDSTHVEDLRCEYLIEPMGVDALNPRLSWIIVSDRRGEKQTAYQVLVPAPRGC